MSNEKNDKLVACKDCKYCEMRSYDINEPHWSDVFCTYPSEQTRCFDSYNGKWMIKPVYAKYINPTGKCYYYEEREDG